MFGFPVSTDFNKRIPKQKFYENLDVTPAMRRVFAEQIQTVFWKNKLAALTLNIATGEAVTEIEVLEVRLTQPQLDESVLRQMDREIPYHILFILTCDENAQAWIGYKEPAATGNKAFQVNRYYHTPWMPQEDLHFAVDGLDMDAVYESLVRQIAEMQGEVWDVESGVAENVARTMERKKLEKQIAALENKMRKEKQLNRQMEMHAELKRLRKEKENL